MVAVVGVRVADNRLGGLQPVQNRTGRVPRFISGVALLLLAFTLAASLASAVPRRSYYQLAVILNDSHAPDVDFTFWLDSPYANDPVNNSDVMAATIGITAVFGPELAYQQQASGTYREVVHNQIGDWSFYANTTETSQTANPVFTTVAITVTYTDNFDQNPRTIYRSLTFALKYVAPPPPVNTVWAAAAGLGAAGVLGLGVYVTRRARLEELYLMHDSGMLIRHWSRTQGMVHDSDIMSGMLIVLQEFVRDSFDLTTCILIVDIEPASVIKVAPAWSDAVMVDDHVKRKILLLGDGAVGKTSLIRRFVVDKFSDDYITTIGTKVTKKDLRIESPSKATDMTFMIWDVLGQKGYRGIQESSFQGAKGALLVYDVTRPETAESLHEYWIPHLLSVTDPIPIVLVANKVDLADSRRKVQEDLDDLKDVLQVDGFVSSAKTGLNVEAGFLGLAKAMIAKADAKVMKRDAVEETWNPFIAVTDQIIVDFCEFMGGQEAAMPIVRQQLTRAGIDVKAPTKEGLRLAVDYLAEAESSFRNAADVEASKLRRLGWIKEVA